MLELHHPKFVHGYRPLHNPAAPYMAEKLFRPILEYLDMYMIHLDARYN
jgi:hypothetical protein